MGASTGHWAAYHLPPGLPYIGRYLRGKKRMGTWSGLTKKIHIYLCLVAKAVNFFLFPLVSFPFNQNITALPRQFLLLLPPSLWVTCRLLFIFLPVIESVSCCLITSLCRLRSIAIDRYSPATFCLLLRDDFKQQLSIQSFCESDPALLVPSQATICTALRCAVKEKGQRFLAFCSPAYSPNPNLSLSFLPHDRDLYRPSISARTRHDRTF